MNYFARKQQIKDVLLANASELSIDSSKIVFSRKYLTPPRINVILAPIKDRKSIESGAKKQLRMSADFLITIEPMSNDETAQDVAIGRALTLVDILNVSNIPIQVEDIETLALVEIQGSTHKLIDPQSPTIAVVCSTYYDVL